MGSIWLHDLDEVLAPAVGDGIVDLILEPGWETASRGSGGLDSFDGWLWHHTVSGPASDGRNDVNYIRYYNPFAPSPICQLYLPRTGVAWITAAGACNHGGRGGPWRPGDSTPIVRRDMANRTLGGTEMANWGDGKEAWPWRQIRAAIECAARISIAEGWTEIEHHLAHKEYPIEHGAVVLTRRGLVPIEEVLVGDLVWTHQRRWRPVTAVHRRGVMPAVRLIGAGHPGIGCSADHPWMDAEWNTVRADHMPGRDWVTPSAIDDVAVPDIDGFRLDPALLRFIGAYVADGFCTKAHDAVVITPRSEKASLVEGWAEAAGLNIRASDPKNGATQLKVYSSSLARFLSRHFGRKALDKTIPAWLLANPDKFGQEFLDGYLHGDGHWLSSESVWIAGTSSRRLAFGLRMLGSSLGWSTYVNARRPAGKRPSGLTANADEWLLRLNPAPSERPNVQQIRPGPAGFYVGRVRRYVEATPTEMTCLTVEEDHSFVVDGIVTHNCGPGTSQAGRKIDPLGPWENHPDGLWPNNSSWGASQGEISLFRTLVAQRIAELTTPTPVPPPGGSPVFHIIANAQDAAFRMKGFNDVVAIIGGTPQPVTRENARPLFGISDGKLTEIVQNPVPTHLETVAWLRAQGIAMTASQGGV